MRRSRTKLSIVVSIFILTGLVASVAFLVGRDFFAVTTTTTTVTLLHYHKGQQLLVFLFFYLLCAVRAYG